MKFEDMVPIIVLLVYVALVFFKQRRLKPGDKKRADPMDVPEVKAKETAAQKITAVPPIPKLFSIFGESLGSFLSNINDRFRMELEKSRNQGLDPDKAGAVRFDSIEEPVKLKLCVPQEKPDFLEEKCYRRMGLRDKKTGVRGKKTGFPNRLKARRMIRNAVVWSEILGPPVSLRGEKRSWD